jgi:hypothetical protein
LEIGGRISRDAVCYREFFSGVMGEFDILAVVNRDETNASFQYCVLVKYLILSAESEAFEVYGQSIRNFWQLIDVVEGY